jgi:hypothetical protein
MRGPDAMWFVVSVLAVWRATHLLHAEDGPWDLLARLRRLAGRLGAARVVDCFYCLSLWVSLPLAALVADDWLGWVVLWLGLSGGAILVHRATAHAPATAPAWREEPDHGDPDHREPDNGGNRP